MRPTPHALVRMYRIKKKVIFSGGIIDSTTSQLTEENILVMNLLFGHFLLLVSHTEEQTVKGRIVIHYFAFYPYV
jgi:hypothetical protein